MAIDNDEDRFAMNGFRDLQNAVERAQEWYRNWQGALMQIERRERLLYQLNETGDIENVPYEIDHDTRRLWPDRSADI